MSRLSFFITAFFFAFVSSTTAQTSAFVKLSCPEKWWAFTHPFVACKAYTLTVKAREASKEMLNDSTLDHDSNGGQVDAFRHSYWMALLAQHMAPRKARSLGKAHEKGDYKAFKKGRMEEGALPDSMSGVMDLYNNDIGIELGLQNKILSEMELKKLVKERVLTGEMKILKKSEGTYVTCDGMTIDMSLYRHIWGIPKCLINSDARRD